MTTSPSFSSSSAATSASSTSWFSGIVRGRSDRSSSVKMSNSSVSGMGAADFGGPIKGKNQFRGLLFKYGSKPIQVVLKAANL
ncbi:hypothetical protein SLEP1_g29774 [Rubroshorea leprosula]|uniref:Uncharacterized protein n=1 Tax=Rubroshorea leprosula TaxID=152421 RepID=A0AAV5K8H4_9ROSI|nr:hypothetical protein SLEP1_g29774 [Rubroshorea leprosula]